MHKITNPTSRVRRIAKAYLIIKQMLIEKGFAPEIDWQYSVSLYNLDESTLLRESAWVILSGGFRETIVRRRFPQISTAFLDWKSASSIVQNAAKCKNRALRHFNHTGKIDAILSVASRINQDGFYNIVREIVEDGIRFLQQFCFIGPVTSYHLAKNIGVPLAKPDRHLSRLSDNLGYNDVQQLCVDIAKATDEPIAVVDLVLWRYSTLNQRNIIRFSKLIGREHDFMGSCIAI
jgi:hypothetical protein